MDIDYRKLEQGRYEAERLPADFSPESPVPDFGYNVLNEHGLLYRPVLDEHRLRQGRSAVRWPGARPFAVCLTHDVDTVSLRYLRHLRRARTAPYGRRHASWKRAVACVRHQTRLLSPEFHARADPLHCYERWLAIEKEKGARSTFFFWPGWSAVRRHHQSDCAYDLTDPVVFDTVRCTVGEMIREIDRRGWEIGLHPSWYSFDDPDELCRQKEALESAVGHDVESVRQHFLHYDIRVTPRVHEQAGLRFDSTLGFNDNVGFRFGTCHPWKIHDLRAEEPLSVIEIPLIVQDGAMLRPDKGLRLDRDRAYEYVRRMVDGVERVGGVLTLLWHTRTVADRVAWELYAEILEFLKTRDPWFATVGEVGRHWEGCWAAP